MMSLQLPSYNKASLHRHHRHCPLTSLHGSDLFCSLNYGLLLSSNNEHGKRNLLKVYALSGDANNDNSKSPLKMNLNEYMVNLDKPLGIRFALTAKSSFTLSKKGYFVLFLFIRILRIHSVFYMLNFVFVFFREMRKGL